MALEKQKLELQKQKLELEKSNRDLESFAHIAAHDMKNPVHLIHSLSMVIDSDSGNKLTSESKDSLQKIEKSCKRVVNMVDRILDFASVGEDAIKSKPLNTGEIITEILQELEPQIKENGAEVVVGELPCIDGSQTLIRQAFQNLISNAIKYRSNERKLIIEIHQGFPVRRGRCLYSNFG